MTPPVAPLRSRRGVFDAVVRSNRCLCDEHHLLRLDAGRDFPPSCPGQFVQLACGRGDEGGGPVVHPWLDDAPPRIGRPELVESLTLLRRPFSLAGREQVGTRTVLDIVCRVVGRSSAQLAGLGEGDAVSVMGPLGNCFRWPDDMTLGVLVGGGVTSHISILARSLGMPMVISDAYELLDLPDKTPLLVDAESGNLYIHPDDTILKRFRSQQATRPSLDEQKKQMQTRTCTQDGTEIQLLANINLLIDLKLANELNCNGVGLYRTEFPFIIRTTFPSEAEQVVIYSKLTEAMQGKSVTFRSLDVGGDKTLSYYHDIQEQNPAMGMRSIRFSLKNRVVFTQQIRAILRAGVDADLRIMFPMISSLDEFCQAREVVWEAITDLRQKGTAHNDAPQLGMMVELPCVVHLMDELAREVDFFSIGTNDFIQFMLGVDRTNDSVADCYLPHHPAVLHGLHTVVQTANRHGRAVSICGDMAHEPRYIPFLLGIGIRALSVDPAYLLRTQQTVLDTSIPKAEDFAQTLLTQRRISDVETLLDQIQQTHRSDAQIVNATP